MRIGSCPKAHVADRATIRTLAGRVGFLIIGDLKRPYGHLERFVWETSKVVAGSLVFGASIRGHGRTAALTGISSATIKRPRSVIKVVHVRGKIKPNRVRYDVRPP